MRKYILLFAVASFIGISHAIAQTPVTTTTGQSVVIKDSPGSSDNSSKGTITKAGKNEQSVYTPPSDANQNNDSGAASPASQQATPNKEQPAVIDPKRQK